MVSGPLGRRVLPQSRSIVACRAHWRGLCRARASVSDRLAPHGNGARRGAIYRMGDPSQLAGVRSGRPDSGRSASHARPWRSWHCGDFGILADGLDVNPVQGQHGYRTAPDVAESHLLATNFRGRLCPSCCDKPHTGQCGTSCQNKHWRWLSYHMYSSRPPSTGIMWPVT